MDWFLRSDTCYELGPEIPTRHRDSQEMNVLHYAACAAAVTDKFMQPSYAGDVRDGLDLQQHIARVRKVHAWCPTNSTAPNRWGYNPSHSAVWYHAEKQKYGCGECELVRVLYDCPLRAVARGDAHAGF